MDYHDLADIRIHPDIDACFEQLPGRIFAFTTQATTWFSEISFEPSDALLFGTEPTGLPAEHLAHPRVTQQVRINIVPARRSLNLANSAAIAVFKAWRQLGFTGAV